jgi:hypothetical protein
MITSAQRRRQILPEIASVVNSHRTWQISTEDSGQGKQAAEQPSRNGPNLGHGKRNMFAQQEATQLTKLVIQAGLGGGTRILVTVPISV